MDEIYISTDVETDGPIPGPHSMLNFASAAFTAAGDLLSTFEANLQPLAGAAPHARTMEFWAQHPREWEKIHQDPQPPQQALPRYAAWLEGLPGRPVFVGYPIAFDFMFVYWYLIRFHGSSPFGHNGIDVRTYAMAMLKKDYLLSGKPEMPRHWFSSHPHTHYALDDAIEQGRLFITMLMENRGES